VTVKWWGRHRKAPSFTARTGLRGAIVSEAAYQGGLAATLGMAWRCPAALPAGEASIAERLRVAGELLDEGYDFVHVHDKAADEAGHTKDPQAKMRMIASLDRGLEAILTWQHAVMIVTGDHATPASGRMLHSGDAVPLALAGPSVRPDPVQAFGEKPQAAGWLGRITGADILPLALNAADRARFLGGRATAARDAIGRPATWKPLCVTPGQLDRGSPGA
jgi:2,3-bisphosphoglycerate-independent phosphoglycerate mutase